MRLPFAAFFDLDGTLATGNNPPLACDAQAIRAFRAAGNYVFLCTGRSCGYLYDAVLDIGFDGIVSGGGAHVTLGDEVLFRSFVTPAQLDPLLRRFEDADETLILETERCMVQLASPRDHKVLRDYPLIRTAEDWYARYGEEVVSKLTIYGAPMPPDMKALIEAHLSLIEHPTYYEAVPMGCSKATGMAHVLHALGIPRERAIAFGDSANDAAMLEYAGISVVMGNAHDDIKALADFVTLPCTDGGVAYAFEHFTF
ncbi:MAG: HAD family phosphatase [Clostridia bacterium]|nr:HAD family phosphatase [Clostridia bacterium]